METDKQVGVSHYDWNFYCDKSRWCSFWHQLDEIISLKPKSILEAGPGPGITGVVLKHLGYDYKSLDIADDLKPDYLGSVLNIPLADNSFDIIVCFQILEHIPYESFKTALNELFRVSKKHVIISLPDASIVYPQSLFIPKIGKISFSVPRPLKPQKHVFNGEHYWEINKLETPLKRVKKDIEETGFKINKTYRVFENPYHRFFVLIKQ